MPTFRDPDRSTAARELALRADHAEASNDIPLALELHSRSLDLDPDTSGADRAMLEYSVKGFSARRAIRRLVTLKLPIAIAASRQTRPTVGQRSDLPVFMYWGQGFQNSPPIVETCLESALRYVPSSNLILLDDTNISRWVELPDSISKFKGVYRTAFSDLLRFELLSKYGGIWLDATCLVTDDILARLDDLLEPSGFFAFKKKSDEIISSWFLASDAGAAISLVMRELLRSYWTIFEKPITYFYAHQLFAQAYRLDSGFAAEVDKIPRLPENPRAVNRRLRLPADRTEMDRLLAMSFVHKLTYKLSKEELPENSLLSLLVDSDSLNSSDGRDS